MPARPGRRDSCGPEVLDHHFLVAQHFVDVQRDALLRAADHHHRPRAADARRRARAGLQQRAQPEERQRSVAEREGAAGIGLLDLLGAARAARSRPASTARPLSASPQRSITTCVTAVVSGSTSLKLVPWPAAVAVSMRPPMALTSERTTSMPTPRPASSVTWSAVLKPGVKIRLARSASLSSAPGRDQAQRRRPCSRMRARSSPAPSSRNSTPTSLPSCVSVT